MGDPQASFDKVMDVLARHQLLVGQRLAPDVQLISIGVKHRRELLGWGILLGLTAGFVTDLVIDAAGG